MRLIIEKDYDQLSKWAAEHVIERINKFNPTPSLFSVCLQVLHQSVCTTHWLRLARRVVFHSRTSSLSIWTSM